MPGLLRPTARWWYDLPVVGDEPSGPALTDALLAEEAAHGVTRDVAWAYAEAIPRLLGPEMVALRPLAFRRGALRAAALERPVEFEGLYHVQTSSPEVCRALGATVPSFSVRGEACVRALLEHGSAVREVVANHCPQLELDAPFRLTIASAYGPWPRWFEWYVAEPFVPVVRLDVAMWLCWDRDLQRPSVVTGHDTVVTSGRWGPRDVLPEAEPPPWAEPEAHTLAGDGWAATMFDNHRRGPSSVVVDGERGWCRVHAESESPYHAALRTAWRTGAPLQEVRGTNGCSGNLAWLRLDGDVGRFGWLGLERVLRLRGPELTRLTVDHDLRHAARVDGMDVPDEMLAQYDEQCITARSLPTHAPDEGSIDVAPGDRFVLLDKSSQQVLEREVGGAAALAGRLVDGSPRLVARWIRDVFLRVDHDQPVVIVDAGATVTTRASQARAEVVLEPTMRELDERPAAFHGRRIRLRGIYRRSVEVSSFSGAWFTGEWTLGPGIWLVEAEGVWLHDEQERGHFGQYASELRGTMTAVDTSQARPIAAGDVRSARRYVPLSSELTIERRLRGWTHAGRWVTRLGPNSTLPTPDAPERCIVRANFIVGVHGNLGLLAWEVLRSEPLAPERTTADAAGLRGRYVEIEGVLAPTDRLPRLDGALDVAPPSLFRSGTLPGPAALARYRSVLGAGRRVTVRGEMDGERSLLALAITDESGPLEL